MKGVDKDDGALSSNSVEQNGGTGINSIYKMIPLFIDVRFLMGKWKVLIITLLANFKFSSDIFINH